MRKGKMFFFLSHIERETKNLVLAHLGREFSVPKWSSNKRGFLLRAMLEAR